MIIFPANGSARSKRKKNNAALQEYRNKEGKKIYIYMYKKEKEITEILLKIKRE